MKDVKKSLSDDSYSRSVVGVMKSAAQERNIILESFIFRALQMQTDTRFFIKS